MLLLKKFDARAARKRYRTYLKTNALYLWVFFACFLLGLVLCTVYVTRPEGIDAYLAFRLHWHTRAAGGILPFALYGFCALLPYFLASLVFGITVYAPLCGVVSSALCAFFSGAYLRLLLGLLSETGECFPAFYFLLGLVPLAFLACGAFAFSSAVSFHIFAPGKAHEGEAEHAFGGALFCGPYYENTINLRFLFSYLFAFFALVLLLFLLCLAQAALVLKL